ncbi:MAG: hypothetical protein RL376_1665 [Verrucomicrobiota bacterium]|jgi:autotransporter-associated beta strand protein
MLRPALLLFVATAPLAAQTTTYTGTSGSVWSAPAHWAEGLPSGEGRADLVFFNTSTGTTLTSHNDLSGLVVRSLTFPAKSADNVLAGNALTLTQGITVAAGNWQAIQLPLELPPGPHAFDVRNGRLTIASVISGPGLLSKTGGATLVIEKANTHSGGTTVNSGVIRLASGGPAGALRGTLTINSGGGVLSQARDSLGFEPGLKVDRLFITEGYLTHESAENLTFSSLSLHLSGGTVKSTQAGAIDLYNAVAIGGPDQRTTIETSPSAKTSTLAGRLNLRQGDDDPVGTVITVADGPAETDLRISAVIADGKDQGRHSVLQKLGPGRLELAAANTYTGATILRAGTLALGVDHALSPSAPLILHEGQLAVGSHALRTGPLDLQGPVTLTLEDGAQLSLAATANTPWPATARLRILGRFKDEFSLRFGTSETGLTMEQLARITINDRPACIDTLGYLSALPE